MLDLMNITHQEWPHEVKASKQTYLIYAYQIKNILTFRSSTKTPQIEANDGTKTHELQFRNIKKFHVKKGSKGKFSHIS